MSAAELAMLWQLGLALFTTKPLRGKPVDGMSASEVPSLQLLGLEAAVFTTKPVRGKKG